VVSPTLATRSVSVGGVVREPREKSGADDVHDRLRRIDNHEVVSLDESEKKTGGGRSRCGSPR